MFGRVGALMVLWASAIEFVEKQCTKSTK